MPTTSSRVASLVARWAARIRSAFRPASLEDLVYVLTRLVEERRFADVLDTMQRHPWLRRRVRRALAAPDRDARDTIAILAAELMACGWIGAGVFSSEIVHDWMLPLLQRSTGRHLAKTAVGRYLVDHLGLVDDPRAVVQAIEASIRPRSWSDYSNFRVVFSLKTWPILRRHLVRPRLISELDLFVTSIDRTEFWNEFNRLETHP